MTGGKVAIASMTGFARAAGADQSYAWTWEAKSVNGRGLDVRCRLPPGMDRLEGQVRAAAAKRFARGNLSLNLAIDRQAAAGRLQVNRAALEQVLTLARELKDKIDAAPPRIDGLLAVRGVVEIADESVETDEARAHRDQAMLATLDETLANLAAARAVEGEQLARTMTKLLDEIALLTESAAASAGAQPEAIRDRLQAKLADLLGEKQAVPSDRLAQEVAMLVTRADVREEIDRLRAHVSQARGLLTEGGAIGRKFDFLAQEFNREANTLCSKSSDIELTRIGLSLKAVIDQLREQAANIE